jgi:uncharacterized protein
MAKLGFHRILPLTLAAASVCIVAGLAVILWQQSRTQYITLAAGDSHGESYILSSALKTVVERHYPRIRINLLETGGTVENIAMLSAGRAQLATAQADIVPGPTARTVAVLYDDTFQLMVRKDSHIQQLTDLRGKRIALARSGGQFQSFLRVAEHFGLHEEDFHFIGSSDTAADLAFENGQADAIFRVRAIGNPSIQRLVQKGDIRFLSIEHAAAMKINQPAFQPASIPEGAYLGNPPVPDSNVPTVAVQRTLLALDSASPDAIRAVTSVLMERRQEMMQEIPANLNDVRLLLAQVHQPQLQVGLGPALHSGAASFYNKDKPSFLMAHADYIGLVLTVALMVASWIWELNRWMQRRQKSAADHYNNRAVALITAAQEAQSDALLVDIWRELLATLTKAVQDLDADRMSQESFNSFRSILQIGLEVIKERRAILASSPAASSQGA